ncbi:hypothetical protein F5B20DRAFT_579048 [Whalleya microplaca]|nr:hypothetical protein F5B20DRAFT_579048 [Whalleya microplaca]
MVTRSKSKERCSPRKVTPPSPTYMNSEQFATYLAGLRDSRTNRPVGARPLPSSAKSTRESLDRFATGRSTPVGGRESPFEDRSSPQAGRSSPFGGRKSLGSPSVKSEINSSRQRTNSDAPRPRGSRPSYAGSMASRYSTLSTSGRDYYPEKPATPPLKPSEVVPTATYIERGQRWMEKEEAFSLHQAMDAMDLKDQDKDKDDDKPQDDDETRIYGAALDEAAELVWQHQHGVKPPEPGTPYRYKPHMRKNSYAHARTASAGRYGSDIGATGLARDSIRSFSPTSSSGSDRASSPGSRRESVNRNVSSGSSKGKSHNAPRPGSAGRRLSSMKRNITGEIERPFSGDQIWEEPEGSAPERNPRQPRMPADLPALKKTRNPPNKVQFASESDSDGATPSISKKVSIVEIHKNSPTQSRNPNYTMNSPSDSPRTSQDIPKKNGMEIRSDDIRQATSMRLKDRSAKLPTPSAVSDRPGRPIVSFDKNWKAPEEATDSKPEEPSRIPHGVGQKQPAQGPQPPVSAVAVTPDVQAPPPPSRSTRTPGVPSIQVDSGGSPHRKRPSIAVSNDSPAVPSIVLPGDDSSDDNRPGIPAIVTPDDNQKPSARPLPNPKTALSHLRNARGGGLPQGHWSPDPGASRRATAICHECNFPIEGRFVALNGASERFHPQCFRCYTCGTNLEALEISPEPDHHRAARLERIRRRAAGEELDEEPGQTMAEDGDARLRFYCHLDWHELYAPRCQHCKTPILGEHVVALGAHWHYGHFFCAECGDPFERGMTHIEKDGYAWCVNCQTKRTERRAPKCRRCRKAVIGQYVRALGAEWHDECFRCAACHGGFDDGQIFPMEERGESFVLCTKCRAMELKM